MTPDWDIELRDTGHAVVFRAVSAPARRWVQEHAQHGYWPTGGLTVPVTEARGVLHVLCAAGLAVLVL